MDSSLLLYNVVNIGIINNSLFLCRIGSAAGTAEPMVMNQLPKRSYIQSATYHTHLAKSDILRRLHNNYRSNTLSQL